MGFFIIKRFLYICFMKKYIIIFGLGVIVSLTSCGGESTTSETTDSLSVQVDTSSVSATDTSTSQISQDETKLK